MIQFNLKLTIKHNIILFLNMYRMKIEQLKYLKFIYPEN